MKCLRLTLPFAGQVCTRFCGPPSPFSGIRWSSSTSACTVSTSATLWETARDTASVLLQRSVTKSKTESKIRHIKCHSIKPIEETMWRRSCCSWFRVKTTFTALLNCRKRGVPRWKPGQTGNATDFPKVEPRTRAGKGTIKGDRKSGAVGSDSAQAESDGVHLVLFRRHRAKTKGQPHLEKPRKFLKWTWKKKCSRYPDGGKQVT